MEQSIVNELESLDSDVTDFRLLALDAASLLQSTLEDAIDELEDADDPFARPVSKLDALIKRLEAGEKVPSLDDLLQQARGIRSTLGRAKRSEFGGKT